LEGRNIRERGMSFNLTTGASSDTFPRAWGEKTAVEKEIWKRNSPPNLQNGGSVPTG